MNQVRIEPDQLCLDTGACILSKGSATRLHTHSCLGTTISLTRSPTPCRYLRKLRRSMGRGCRSWLRTGVALPRLDRWGVMMVCQQCGLENGEGALSCSTCGGDRFGKRMAAPESRPTMVRFSPPVPPMVPCPVAPGRLIARLMITCAGLSALAGVLLLPLLVGNRDNMARTSACANNLKQMGEALQVYVQDNDAMPGRHQWGDALLPIVGTRGALLCPAGQYTATDSSHAASNYGFNSLLSGRSPDYITEPARVVVFFDASGNQWNGSGGLELLDARHRGASNIGFLDGHVKTVAQLHDLQWDPQFGSCRPGPHS